MKAERELRNQPDEYHISAYKSHSEYEANAKAARDQESAAIRSQSANSLLETHKEMKQQRALLEKEIEQGRIEEYQRTSMSKSEAHAHAIDKKKQDDHGRALA